MEDKIRQIPEIVFEDEERCGLIQRSCISLKCLFIKENMDENHVDCLVLYRIASGVLRIMEEMAAISVWPGLYDLSDFYVDLSAACQVYLLHPERFQMADREQDYEWYPEDERVFGDLVYFDEDRQRLADTRLIYKVLVASSKGNVRIPPAETAADYSPLFYKTLSPDWKEGFRSEKGMSHARMRELLEESIALERESARTVRRRQKQQVINRYEEMSPVPAQESNVPGRDPDSGWPKKDDTSSGVIRTIFVLLRTEIRHAGKLGRMLYQQQDQLELEADLTGKASLQAFVYGDGSIYSRDYQAYPRGFRIQLEQQIRDYPAGEAMIIASELVEKAMNDNSREAMKPTESAEIIEPMENKEPDLMEDTEPMDPGKGIEIIEAMESQAPGAKSGAGRTVSDGKSDEDGADADLWRVCLITDGRLKNDRVFQCALERLSRLKRRGAEISFLYDASCHCEACDRLAELADKAIHDC